MTMMKRAVRVAVRFFLYAVFMLVALASVPLFQENVFLGLTLNSPAFLYLLLRALNVIRKSRVAVGFMLFSLGMLELSLTGRSLILLMAGASFVLAFFYTWIRAEVQEVSRSDAIDDKESGTLDDDSPFHNRLFDPVGTPKNPADLRLFVPRD